MTMLYFVRDTRRLSGRVLEGLKAWARWYFRDKTRQTSGEARPGRFECLDGFRGLCVFLVVVQHFIKTLTKKCEDLLILDGLGQYFGVYGFFILSSFLLTYRLTKEFNTETCKVNESELGRKLNRRLEGRSRLRRLLAFNTRICACKVKRIGLAVVKYAIKRFLRIYVSLIVVTTAIKLAELADFHLGGSYVFNSWLEIVTLQPTGPNHLWTMAPEIKYYFLIPAICLLGYWLKYASIVVSILGYVAVFFIDKHQLNSNERIFEEPERNALKSSFTIFLLGSLIAYVYYYVIDYAKFTRVKAFLESSIVNALLTALSFLLLTFVIYNYSHYWHNADPKQLNSVISWMFDHKVRENVQASYFVSVLLLIMASVNASNNLFAKLFARNFVLISYGKYSFGMYLLHPCAIYYVSSLNFSISGIEPFVLVILSTHLLGFLFFYLVENPLMNLADFLNGRLASLSVWSTNLDVDPTGPKLNLQELKFEQPSMIALDESNRLQLDDSEDTLFESSSSLELKSLMPSSLI